MVPAEGGLALLMEDAGDTNLAALIRSRLISIADFLIISIQLAEAVAGLHTVRIVHRDIHPGNIVWNSESEVATFCDLVQSKHGTDEPCHHRTRMDPHAAWQK
jgi:serine/threonine protein kinase